MYLQGLSIEKLSLVCVFLLLTAYPGIAEEKSYSKSEIDTKIEAINQVFEAKLEIRTSAQEDLEKRNEEMVKDLEDKFNLKQAYLEHDRQSLGLWIGGVTILLALAGYLIVSKQRSEYEKALGEVKILALLVN